jgi:hypothetical protein
MRNLNHVFPKMAKWLGSALPICSLFIMVIFSSCRVKTNKYEMDEPVILVQRSTDLIEVQLHEGKAVVHRRFFFISC